MAKIVKVDQARRIRLPRELDEISPGDSVLLAHRGDSITIEKVDPTMKRIHTMSKGRLVDWREKEHRSDEEVLRLAHKDRDTQDGGREG